MTLYIDCILIVSNPFQFVFREQLFKITFQANGSNQTVSAWNKHCSTWFEPSFDDRTLHKPFICPLLSFPLKMTSPTSTNQQNILCLFPFHLNMFQIRTLDPVVERDYSVVYFCAKYVHRELHPPQTFIISSNPIQTKRILSKPRHRE